MSYRESSTAEPIPKKPKAEVQASNGVNHWEVTAFDRVVAALYSESVMARLWNVAARALGSCDPPKLYPEFTDEDGAQYVYRSLDFWTSGFFPGSLYLLLERMTGYTASKQSNSSGKRFGPHALQLEHLCRWWTINLHRNALKRDTHDLGFMIAPWAMKAWKLHRDPTAYNSLVTAAHSLSSRFNATTQCLRSWDVCITERYSFTDPSKDFLVIIDNMLNLDLLFWAARETGNLSFFEIALAHARTARQHHVRQDHSTFHVVNLDVNTGRPNEKFTNQGYSDDSCWARGQAWGILGFMQTFEWTGDRSFLDTARGLADYFLAHLPPDGVPYWDFDAPVTEEIPRDTSAAMIAACGLLLIFKALVSTPEANHYLQAALDLVDKTVAKYLNPATFRFEKIPVHSGFLVYSSGSIREDRAHILDTYTVVDNSGLRSRETILDGATINNHEFAPRRWANHGLVYADYYFLVFGNMLLDLGLVNASEI